MATTTIKAGAFSEGNSLIVNAANPRPPFAQGVGIAEDYLTVGTDFTAGDDVVIEVQTAKAIKFADVKEKTGDANTSFVHKNFVIADLSGTTGKTITMANCTKDIMFHITHTV